MSKRNILLSKSENDRRALYSDCKHFNSYIWVDASNSLIMRKYNNSRFAIEQEIYDGTLDVNQIDTTKESMDRLFNSIMIPFLIFSIILIPFTAFISFLISLSIYLGNKSTHKRFFSALDSYKSHNLDK